MQTESILSSNMLEKLEVWDFQKYCAFVIEFGPHVTSIVGRTEAGKSTLLRALGWVGLNWGVDDMVRWGAARAKARLTLDGGRAVTRVKGKGVNVYRLGAEKFVSFGVGVPAPVAHLLNLSPESFARQLDGPYWFSLSPPQVSKELNKVVNLDLIDYSLATAATNARNARFEVGVAEKRLKEARTKRDALKWVPDACAKLQQLEQLEQALRQTRQARAKLAEIAGACRGALAAKGSALSVRGAVAGAVAAGARVRAARAARATLAALVKALGQARRVLDNCIPKNALDPLAQVVDRLRALRRAKGSLTGLVGQIRRAEEDACRHGRSATRHAAELTRRWGGRCPACGRPTPVAKATSPSS